MRRSSSRAPPTTPARVSGSCICSRSPPPCEACASRTPTSFPTLAVATLVRRARAARPVEIIVPSHQIDSKTVRRASRSLWEPLLEAGVEIYEYQPTMYHVKVVIVDEVWTSVGSTNFDNRRSA